MSVHNLLRIPSPSGSRVIRLLGLAGLAFAVTTIACGDVTTTPTTEPTAAVAPSTNTVGNGLDEFPYGVENISWDNRGLNMDMEKWPINAKITYASHSGDTLTMENNCSEVWKHRQEREWSKPSVGNYWLIGKVNGQWHGATVDWVGVNRTGMSDLNLHGGAGMYSDLTEWRPVPGEEAYVMISTHARAYVDTSNQFRTQIVKIKMYQ